MNEALNDLNSKMAVLKKSRRRTFEMVAACIDSFHAMLDADDNASIQSISNRDFRILEREAKKYPELMGW